MKYKIPKTELSLKKTLPIDQLNINDGIDLIIKEQKKASNDVKKSTKIIEAAITKITEHLTMFQEGRLIYVGAGTSGRIGLQDGVELFPTFGWPKERSDFIIAGGLDAIFNSVENAEDDIELAKKLIKEKNINSKDVVIGLAASGNTPFTCKALEEAMHRNALIISISNNPNGKILGFGKVKIILNTKEEVIAGSTRLKAGTAQKICLNVISSIVMTKLGFVKNGKMINLVPTNKKLRDRKLRIINEESI